LLDVGAGCFALKKHWAIVDEKFFAFRNWPSLKAREESEWNPSKY